MKSKTIGEIIKDRRIELGMTQEQLAERLGYKSKSTINKVELGINDVAQRKIPKYADVLNTTPAYLMGWSEKHREIDNIGTAYDSLNKNTRDMYMNMINSTSVNLPDILKAYGTNEEDIKAIQQYLNLSDEKKKLMRQWFTMLQKE